MKKLFALLTCFCIFFSLLPAVSAASNNERTVVFSETTTLADGLTVVDELIDYPQQARASVRTSERRKSIYDGDTLIAVIAFKASFSYDGSSVSVLSKTVTQTDTYESWTYSQESFTSSGGTVTLAGKLKKWLIFSNSFTMSLTCDVNGNTSIG